MSFDSSDYRIGVVPKLLVVILATATSLAECAVADETAEERIVPSSEPLGDPAVSDKHFVSDLVHCAATMAYVTETRGSDGLQIDRADVTRWRNASMTTSAYLLGDDSALAAVKMEQDRFAKKMIALPSSDVGELLVREVNMCGAVVKENWDRIGRIITERTRGDNLGTQLSVGPSTVLVDDEECELPYKQLQVDVMKALQAMYPSYMVIPGETETTVRVGKIVVALNNILRRLCLLGDSISADERQEIVRKSFPTLPPINERGDPVLPATWEGVRASLRLQLMPSTYEDQSLPMNERVIFRPFVQGINLGVVYAVESYYAYLTKRFLAGWGVDIDLVYKRAMENLELEKPEKQLEEDQRASSSLISAQGDGYDAVRLLVPAVQRRAAELLGDPFLAAIPNRDFLVMWSERTKPFQQARNRMQIREFFETEPYALSPDVFRVWTNGRIEVLNDDRQTINAE